MFIHIKSALCNRLAVFPTFLISLCIKFPYQIVCSTQQVADSMSNLYFILFAKV